MLAIFVALTTTVNKQLLSCTEIYIYRERKIISYKNHNRERSISCRPRGWLMKYCIIQLSLAGSVERK